MFLRHSKVVFSIWCFTLCLLVHSQEPSGDPHFNDLFKKYYEFSSTARPDSALRYLLLSEQAAGNSNTEIHNLYLLQKADYARITDNYVDVLKYGRQAFEYFRAHKLVKYELECVYLMCTSYYATAQYDSIIYMCDKYIPISAKEKLHKTTSILYLMKGRALNQYGKLDEAADIFHDALEFAKRTDNKLNQSQILVALAGIYLEINTKTAIRYLNEAKKLDKYIGPDARNSIYTSLGNAYRNIGKYDSALYFYNNNLVLIDKENDPAHYGGMTGNIGNVYADMGRYDEALEKQFESLDYFKRASDSLDIEIAYGTIADIYLKQNKFRDALEYYQKATAMSERLGFIEELIYNYTGLYQCYEKIGNYKEAYLSYKLFKKYNDSIRNGETTKRLTEQELTYRFENQKKEEEIIQKAKDELTAEQIKRQKLATYASIAGGCVLMIFLFVSIRNSNIRKRINQQLEQSHAEIKQQKNIIETKNREITDSIMYASRIQQGILPDLSEIKNLLPGSFLFYRPRDIVSGDFYWMRALKGSDKIGYEDIVGVVVADCTGHGVPGAFMSFIGSTILNQTLNNKKIETPADALNYLNEQLPLTLQSKVKTGQINDGMEAGIFTLNKRNNKLFFAGANLNLIHIRNGVVNEIKGDKHSIGLNIEQQKTFTNSEIDLQKGDCVYMFSDGYPDQFGGEKGKKYKYKNLLNFLNEISSLDADSQFKLLTENFDKWKGDHEQLDDVLLFGLKT